MPFQIRMGVPEMDQLWLDLSTRSLQGGLDKASTWPEGFFESIRIDDANFTRPEQGELPPVVELTR
jgi:hypothetical protein